MPLPLATERLRLRPARINDLDAWCAISRDAEEAWFGAPSSTPDDAQANLAKHIAHHEQHGFGHATEAALAAIQFGLGELRLERIVAVTLPTNRASRNVMDRCGMTFVGVMNVYGHAQVKYAIAR